MPPLDSETRKGARQGAPNRNPVISTADDIETTQNLQARRLSSRFGLAFATAVTISGLAWGIAR